MSLSVSANNFKTVVSNYAKKIGKKSIIETLPTQIHGINPTLTYVPNGKTFELPRFCSVEMQQARRMNSIAARQSKSPVVTTYSKATPQDLERLMSETIKDSYSRVEWTNPKDGKVYNLLKQGNTGDGKVLVRILDSKGAFVKEAVLKQKEVCIVDVAENINSIPLEILTHGKAVLAYAKRFNPFASYKTIDVTSNFGSVSDFKMIDAFDSIIKTINDGEKLDYISISIAAEKRLGDKNLSEIIKIINDKIKCIVGKKSKIRVLFGAGNSGSTSYNAYLANGAEGVGALNKSGKVAEYSASRNSSLTQHYEIGEYSLKVTPFGINITGKKGTDIPFPNGVCFTNTKKGNEALKLIDEYHECLPQIAKLEKEYRKAERCDNFDLLKTIDEKIKTTYKRRDELESQIDRILSEFLPDKSVHSSFYELTEKGKIIEGTSFATPIRTAKLALNDMMAGIL